LKTSGEMKLSGSITASGSMELCGGGAESDYQDYFDTIPGKVVGKMVPSDTVLAALQAGNIDSALRQLFAENHLDLGNSVSVNGVGSYTSFNDLSPEQKALVAQALGYTVY